MTTLVAQMNGNALRRRVGVTFPLASLLRPYSFRSRDHRYNRLRVPGKRGQSGEEEEEIVLSAKTTNSQSQHIPQYHARINRSLLQILEEPRMVLERKIEFMNLFIGIEQQNRYNLTDSQGQMMGYLEERDFNFVKLIMRQIFRTHRPFTVDLFDNSGNKILVIERKFSLVNSHIKAILPYDNDNGKLIGEVLGESVQRWHLWRRCYDLFEREPSDDNSNLNEEGVVYRQFGVIDSGLFAWDFPIYNDKGEILSLISRNFVGLFREFMTDTGVYVISTDKQDIYTNYPNSPVARITELSFNQRCVLLANAISIDFDYFSRHSSSTRGGWLDFSE